jgi:hypothetical protein
LDNVLYATLATKPTPELLIGLQSMPDSQAKEAAGEAIIYEQHPAFPQIWCPSVGRRTHLVEHVGATIMATRKARLDSFLEFDYIGRSGVHKFLEYLTRVDPNMDKTYICQPAIQDFRITYGPSSSSARTIFVDIHEVERRKNGQKKWDKGIIVDGLGNRHKSMELETFGVVDIISRKPTRTQRVTWSRVVGRRN